MLGFDLNLYFVLSREGVFESQDLSVFCSNSSGYIYIYIYIFIYIYALIVASFASMIFANVIFGVKT